MVKKKLHHGEVRQNTTVPVPLHHGAVKTPPWWSGNATVVKFLQHHGEISTFTVVKFLKHYSDFVTAPRWRFRTAWRFSQRCGSNKQNSSTFRPNLSVLSPTLKAQLYMLLHRKIKKCSGKNIKKGVVRL